MEDDELRKLRRQLGREAAYEKMVDLYAKDMYGICLWRLRDPAVAAEALQDALVKVGRDVDRFLAARSIRGYLLRTARHAAADAARKQARDRRRDQEWATEQQLHAQDHGVEHSLEVSEYDALESCLDQVEAETRDAIMLRHKHELPWKEIATRCGCEVDTIRQRVNRALQDVRDCLEGKGVIS